MSAESDFFKTYVQSLENGVAALFVGAGLSISAGFPDWKKLLKGLAAEIDLDIARENDLPAVAQFYVNRFAEGRDKIGQLVRNTFHERPPIPENHRILARLPIRHVWTQNYDKLLERAWEANNKHLEVKSRNEDLTKSNPEASDGILYKMHGTVDHPDEIVLTTDDYNFYPQKRPGFFQILGSDLITHTFLFLGLSFTDPNLGYLMGVLRASFASAPRQHFTILKRPDDDYDARRFHLFTQDLRRYGVHTLVVDRYDGITGHLRQLERCYAQKNVFVSGSFPDAGGDDAERRLVRRVAHDVGALVGSRGLRLITGLGRVVGHSAVAGLVDGVSDLPPATISRRLIVRPISNVVTEDMSVEDFKRAHREDLISQSGIVIIVAGLRQGVDAPGVLQELDFALAQKKVVLPIAATGHAARTAYDRILADPSSLPPEIDVDHIKRLGPETTDPEAIVAALDACLTRLTSSRR